MFDVPKWSWRVWYADHTCRDVTAVSRAGAMRTAAWAARLTGAKKLGTKPVSAKCLHPVGSNHRQGELFGPDETPAAYLEVR